MKDIFLRRKMFSTKKDNFLLGMLLSFGLPLSVLADGQTQSLADQIGMVDVYKLGCGISGSKDTAYAKLKIRDNSVSQTPAPALQLINVELSKKGFTSITKSVIECGSEQFVLVGGNGVYKLKLDTNNSNPLYPSQNYQISFQCYNQNDTITNGSAAGLRRGVFMSKTIKTFKSKNSKVFSSKIYSINCKKNKKAIPFDSSYVQVNINNTTSHNDNVEARLNAQLTRLDSGSTINTSDRSGDNDFGTEVKLVPAQVSGNGDYYISVDTTADSETLVKAKNYEFEYGCFANDGQATSANLTQIQDQ